MSHIFKKFFSRQWLNHLENNILFRYLYIIIIISKIIVSDSQIRSLEPDPYIILKAKQNTTTDLYVLGAIFKGSRKPLCPKHIYVNNNENTEKKSSTDCTKIYLERQERKPDRINTVKLVFGQNFQDLSFMFENLGDILEADLSHYYFRLAVNVNNMFKGCIGLTSINLQDVSSPALKSMVGMFYNCYSLQNLDLPYFDTSLVTNMNSLFYNCKSLSSLKFGNFLTSSALSMSKMFYNCNSLTELNLNNFDTSKVTDMTNMFYECKNLISLDLSSFHTPELKSTNSMFYDCMSLININLSSFDASNIEDMGYMFYNCKSLISLDLSNLNAEKVENMESMFQNCYELVSLNLRNFKTKSIIKLNNVFAYCHSLTSLDLSDFYSPNLATISNMFLNCYSLTYIDVSNLNTTNVFDMKNIFFNCSNLTILNLSNFESSSAIYMDGMFSSCISLVYIDLSRITINSDINMTSMFENCQKLEYINLYSYNEPSTVSIINNYILENTPDNIIICINKNNNYENLKEIINSKSSSKISCGDEPIFTTQIAIPTTDEQKEYFSSTNTFRTDKETNINTDENENSINNDINSEIIDSQKKLNSSSNNLISDEGQTSIIEEDKTNTISNTIVQINLLNIKAENNEEIYLQILDNMMESFSLIKRQNIVIPGKNNFLYEITTVENEKIFLDVISYNNNDNSNDINIIINNNNDNITNNVRQTSKIDLGECENYLKDHYHLNRSISLIIIKFEKISNLSNERSIQYEIYEPINGTKLDLSICDNTTIDVYIPLVLSEELQNLYNQLKEKGYDLFDINSAFYTDICTPFTSPEGTDVMLSDRISYYFNNSQTLCQSNCKFAGYSIETQYLKCKCDISNSQIDTQEVKKFTPKTIYESFYDILKFSNYKVLLYYKLAFSINSLTINNKGSIMAIIYFCVYFLFLLIYCCKGINQLKIDLAKKVLKNPFNTSDDLFKNNYIDSKGVNIQNSKYEIESKNKFISKKYNFPPKRYSKNKSRTSLKKKATKRKINNEKKQENVLSDKNILIENKIVIFKPNYTKKTDFPTLEKDKKECNKENLDNFELNNLEYKEAIIKDKRSFIDIYFALLKREHLIFFTFFIRNDHNLISIKFCRFIFLLCTDMALNVFFFSDETMHKMYLTYGKYDFIQQIPQIVYSTVVSQIIEVFLCFLSLTDKHFYEIKNLKVEEKYQMFTILNCVKRKITFFFIFTFIMFGFYWYAIACFCAVYKNTQMAFIKDSISSFGLGLLYPFILYIFPAVLRIIALRTCKNQISCIYWLSDVIPFF